MSLPSFTDSTLLPVSINGVTYTAAGETTDPQVVQLYAAAIDPIIQVYNATPEQLATNSVQYKAVVPAPGQNPPFTFSTVTGTYEQALQQGIANLQALADPAGLQTRTTVYVGFGTYASIVSQDPNANYNPVTGYATPLSPKFLTYEMANNVDLLIKSLQTAEINIPTTGAASGVTLDAIKRWKDLSGFGLQDIMNATSNAVANAKSLQSVVQLEYVKQGNEIISSQLENLQDAVEINQSVIQTLTDLQNLHNKLGVGTSNTTGIVGKSFTPQLTSLIGGNPNNLPDANGDWRKSYTGYTSNLFGDPIVPVVDIDPNTDGIQPLGNDSASNDIRNQFIQIKNEISAEIAKLKAAGQKEGDGGLIDKLTAILNDMNRTPTAAEVTKAGGSELDAQITFWMLDGQGDPKNTDTGNIQRRLSDGFNAANTVNDTNKEDLRRYMFLFEEFYKSASTILQALNNVVTSFAKNAR
jgi:hypothetical protein